MQGFRRRSHGRRVLLGLLVPGLLTGCSLDGLLKSNELPPNVTDPALTQTPAGARAAYNGTLRQLQVAAGHGSGGSYGASFLDVTSVLSDELTGGDAGSPTNMLDLRQLPERPKSPTAIYSDLFTVMSEVRQRASQAIGLLGDYLPAEPALRAHLYAVEGYAEVVLAEVFCSGIPLSTVDYNGDYTLRPGSTTTEVFTHAAALFDTALALAGATDSVRILNFSRVGQARALLGLGDYAAAAAAVAQVPDGFSYALHYTAGGVTDSSTGFGFFNAVYPYTGAWRQLGVADREGTNGLDYRSSGDPRTRATLLITGFYHPDKYPTNGADTLVLASGVEARLIAAEAALHAGDVTTWLATLNQLRETAITPALPDTTDPGTDSARVSLLFRERAFWLFLTGHRQGDMRRLVRQYGRDQAEVYPVGAGAFGGIYDSYIDVPLPWDERTLNPLYTGCQSRD